METVNPIHAENASETTSARYVFVPTTKIIEDMGSLGWVPSKTQVVKTRNVQRQGFQKHLIRFRNETATINGKDYLEIILINSHDGSSAIRLSLGVYRLVCSNGLVSGSTFESVSVRHTGYCLEKLEKGVSQVLEGAQHLVATIDKMKGFNLNPTEIGKLLSASIALRLPESATPVDLDAVNLIRRNEDASSDLWTVFNRIQENIMAGGIRYNIDIFDAETGLTEVKTRSTRRIRGLTKNMDLNKKLFDTAISFLEAA